MGENMGWKCNISIFRMRRPQTSMQSSNRSRSKMSEASQNSDSCEDSQCIHCPKHKASNSNTFSKERHLELSGTIPLDSQISSFKRSASKNDLEGSWQPESHLKSHMSAAEMEQLKTIIGSNLKYYGEKTKVCCSVKPPKHKLTLPSKTGASVYKGDYNKKFFDTDLAFKQGESYKPVYPFNHNTTYSQNFVPHRSQTPKSAKPRYTPIEDAPRFMNTQYKGEFLPWAAKPIDKFSPVENTLFGSGNFDPRTVYSSDFQGKPSEKSSNPKDNKTSTIFKGFDVPKVSHYQGQYYKKRVAKENNYVPKYESSASTPFDGQYNSEYKKEFLPKEQKHCAYRKVYDKEQMVDMIMNIG